MRMIAITAQILIGVTLLWLGLNGLLRLMAHLPLRCIAQQSIATIFLSRYIALLFGLQLLGSLLLLVGRWRVLALVLLGPIALNIVLFHLFMGPGSFIFALLLALLESGAIWTCRRYFDSTSMLKEKAGPLEGSPWNYFVQPVLSTSRTHSSSKSKTGDVHDSRADTFSRRRWRIHDWR
jgi:putative oxidoreductase